MTSLFSWVRRDSTHSTVLPPWLLFIGLWEGRSLESNGEECEEGLVMGAELVLATESWRPGRRNEENWRPQSEFPLVWPGAPAPLSSWKGQDTLHSSPRNISVTYWDSVTFSEKISCAWLFSGGENSVSFLKKKLFIFPWLYFILKLEGFSSNFL